MFHFSGCKCPICQQPFHEDDDIVVCPECGAPYHRDCYKEQGGCVFADRHAPDFEWKPVPAQKTPSEPVSAESTESTNPEPNFADVSEDSAQSDQQGPVQERHCPRCGAMNPDSALFCEACGAPLHRAPASYAPNTTPNDSNSGPAFYGPNNIPQPDPFRIAGLPPEMQISPEEEFEGVKARDWAAYLGDNAAWYMLHFKRMKVTGHKTAACLSAFFFGPFYFLYRKMWLPAAALIVTRLLIQVPSVLQLMRMAELPVAISGSTLNVLIAVCSTLSVVIQILCGLFGVYIYKKTAARQIKRLQAAEKSSPAELNKAGGTSKAAVLIFVLAAILLSYLIAFLAMGSFPFGGGTAL